ncbi:MAG TPA: Fe-S protein assembly co-chaperone HscB [Polyangia bacterium]|nr:Fe-S protein assembly co-chaperone HscB [Polyangia bacterium]
MICWSCEKNAGEGLTCGSCGAIQPPDAKADHFRVFGIARRYALDLADLERRYKDMTKVLHPDRFARADERARRASLKRSIQLNEAWRTLKDPVRRAEYLLSLSGVEVGAEDGTSKRVDGQKVRLPVAPALLMEVMELREGLAEARTARDDARVDTLAATVRGRREAALRAVGSVFAQKAPDLEAIARDLVAVRYYDRFLDEVAVHEEAAAEASHAG